VQACGASTAEVQPAAKCEQREEYKKSGHDTKNRNAIGTWASSYFDTTNLPIAKAPDV